MVRPSITIALLCALGVGVAAAPRKQGKPRKATAAHVRAKAKPKRKPKVTPKVQAAVVTQKPADSKPADSKKSDNDHMTRPADGDRSPAYHYSMLSQSDCEAELTRRGVPFKREAVSVGVRAPVRLTGSLHGVLFRSDESEKARATSPYEIGDCRLILALDDFAQILVGYDIVEVRHYSMYRPDKTWPADKDAKRHAGALALDAGRFIARDGTVLIVDKHFNGALGAKTCGEGAAPSPVTPEATKLRSIVCDAVDKRIFNVVLTPNYNPPHHNHFHLEVTEGWKSFLVD